MLQSLAGFPAFLAYLCVSLVAIVSYLLVYTWITHHDEYDLIRRNVPSAAVALGLSLLGFSLPVASAVAHAANIVDCIVWSIIALLVQIVAYYVARIPVPELSARIEKGEMAAAIWLGIASVTAGVLSAASMTW